ncbi:recombinase family protein [Eubacteriales bacterium OttesenSCG-928-K08]|nr:recombinase family protein [Eubacteriales bacterium OttesenSCG-928-K08]
MARKSRKHIVDVVATMAPERVLYNAAAYTRLSSDDKKKRGDSLETQHDIIENFVAMSSDIRIVETYTDNNATGTNFDRPGFQRMLADAESGRINCIIVKDLSRFGRNAIDAGYYIEKYLPSLGVRFIAVTDSFDSNDGDGGIILPLKNLIAESYALDISRKCKSVQRQNIRDGKFVGGLAPYGYAKDPQDCRHLIVDPEAADVVRKIFDWAAQHMGIGEITRTLNNEGMLPPSHYKRAKGLIENEKLVGIQYWQIRTVREILHDRVYAGDMEQGKSRTINGKEIPTDPSEWICVKNTHEPVISRDQFNRVQAILQKTYEHDKASRSEAVPYSPNIFKGKVYCAHCGQPMHRHRQNKDGIYWYRCETQWKLKKDACVQVSVKEADIKSSILATLQNQTEAILGEYIHTKRDCGGIMEETAQTRLREISRKQQDSGRFHKSLYESMVSGLLTPDEFVSMKADYEAKLEALSQEADAIRQQRRDQEAAAHDAFDTADATSQAVTENVLTADLIDRLVEKIQVRYDKSFEIQFCFEDGEVKCVG